MMEILAPVGGRESLIAAVCSGADAVYFGTDELNARRNAENFKKEELCSIVSYCHIRGVRAYLALNTLVCDAEINTALSIVKSACNSGVDGIIVQDIGLAELIAKSAPSMPLHASTQMSVHSLGGVKYLHKHGFKRMVLSRECSRRELEIISEYATQNGVELEIFVQGALCMSVSGQCLFSALLGSRSGNRGLCAGTCRLPFSVQGGTGYDLSLKDLNLYRHFDKLRQMGIASLKIEGRMKRPEYVAMAVDCAVTARDNPPALPEKLDTLQKIFSRSGFTDGYFCGKADKSMFGVRSEQDIENSREIKNSAHELYRREYPHIAINMELYAAKNEAARLSVNDGENNVTVYGDVPQTAVSLPLTEDFAYEKLKKCGGTPYYLDKFECKIESGLTLSASSLGQMRTKALNELTAIRGENCPIDFAVPSWNYASSQHISGELIGIFHSSRQITKNLGLEMYFVPLDTSDDELRRLCLLGLKLGVKVPPYIEDESKISADLIRAGQCGITVALADNIGAISLIIRSGMTPFGGSGLNVFNSHSANSSILNGIDILTVSYELSSLQINALCTDKKLCVNAYGRLPLMLIRNCPGRAYNGCKDCDGRITDRLGIDFKLMCEYGITRLYSDRPLYMADRLDEINADYFALCFTDETAEQIDGIIYAYKSRLAPNGLYTRGLYSKGVK